NSNNISGFLGSPSQSCGTCPTAKVFHQAAGKLSATGLFTAMTANFSPQDQDGNPTTLTKAAIDCQVDGFDWQQTIDSLPGPGIKALQSSPGCPGPLNICVAPPSFLDPPPGGYKYFLDPRDANDRLLYRDAFPLYYQPSVLHDACSIVTDT